MQNKNNSTCDFFFFFPIGGIYDMALAHTGKVHERKNPVGKINNDFSSLNKHISI